MRQVFAGEPSDPIGHASLAMLIESSGWVVPTFVLMVTLAVPWLEEVAFRGLLQPALSRLLGSARWGVVMTAGLFLRQHISGRCNGTVCPDSLCLASVWASCGTRQVELRAPWWSMCFSISSTLS